MPKTPSGNPPEQLDFPAFLKNGQNPLVSVIARDTSLEGIVAARQANGMAFVIETHEANQIKVLVTCRHVMERLIEKIGDWSYNFVTKMYLNKPVPVELVGPPICPLDDEMDLAFLVVDDMTKTAKTCLKLTEEDPDLEGVTNFFSARNEGGYLDMMAFNVNISSHPTSELDHLVFTRRTAEGIWLTSPEETVKQREYTAQGMYAHRSFKMPSRPGCSGSPIFDGKGRLYGVNVRGSEPGTDMHDICGDVSICIPVSQIFEARNAVASLIEERIANRPRDLDY